MPPGRAPGRRPLRLLPAVCEVAGRLPGARFAGSVPGVRRRRPPGLGTARVAAALRGRLQIPDPREARPHRSAIWAPSPLHSYDHLSHSLASSEDARGSGKGPGTPFRGTVAGRFLFCQLHLYLWYPFD
uniref:Uncharacterized protein n=1 Tax=Balaenoptera musculus TaxID=9771 RepID=A0A8C0CE47_BALMU